MTAPQLEEVSQFAGEVSELVAANLGEHELTQAVAARLRLLLASGLTLPADRTRADPEHYRMYPLHVAEDGSFSIAAAVWDVGQGTPVHGHETWGVVGIYSGIEREVRFEKPQQDGVPLVRADTEEWSAGQVTVCCTTDDDVHQVSCGGSEPCVGIHVYGADIGTLKRRSYQPETGEVSWFVSPWA